MRKLKISITTSDLQACGWYRVRWPAMVLADRELIELIPYDEMKVECSAWDVNGRQIQIAPSGNPYDSTAQVHETRVEHLVDPPDCDVVVLQRVAEKPYVEMIPLFQELGIAVVVDIDDDLQHLPLLHPQHVIHNRNMTGWRHLKRACALADMVIASTPGIARNYAPHGRVRVIRNRVPSYYLDIEAERDGRTVGWGGTISNHPGDLDVTYGGVGQAVEVRDAKFRVVGLKEGVKKALCLSEEPAETGIVEFLDYAYLLAHLDVTIAPLAENRYNWQGKSGLKVLEAMSLGIPWVASPHPEYVLLNEQSDVGTIAKNRSRDWYRGVLRYLKESSLREEESQRGREFVRENCLLETGVEQWLGAWEAAVENRMAVAA